MKWAPRVSAARREFVGTCAQEDRYWGPRDGGVGAEGIARRLAKAYERRRRVCQGRATTALARRPCRRACVDCRRCARRSFQIVTAALPPAGLRKPSQACGALSFSAYAHRAEPL